jgi:hypothetical protein
VSVWLSYIKRRHWNFLKQKTETPMDHSTTQRDKTQRQAQNKLNLVMDSEAICMGYSISGHWGKNHLSNLGE